MEIILNGSKIQLEEGDWVSNNTGIAGTIIKLDDISDCILVGKERSFGTWIDKDTINKVEQPGGFSSTFDRMVDESAPLLTGYYDVTKDPYLFDQPDSYTSQVSIKDQGVNPDKALKEHSKDGVTKPQFSLIPQHAILEVAKVFTYGAKKYNAYNYSKGEKNITYTDAAMRHINQYLLGKDNDDETGLSHLAHAVSNLLMIIDNEIIGTNIEGRNGVYKV